MSHFVAIILGAVEGLTEFIPISSSGHLIVVRELLHVNDSNGLAFDAIIQLAATLALVFYFWKDIWHLIVTFFKFIFGRSIEQRDLTFLVAIIIGTIPAVILGLFLEKTLETLFRNIHLVAFALLAGSALMWYAQRVAKHNKGLHVKNAFIIGLYQCLALIPGISRSGATISGGLIEGLDQEQAVRFSFLLSVPILIGSGLKKLFEVRHLILGNTFGSSLFLGSITAFIVGLLSIRFLIKYLKTNNLNIFIYYRIALFLAIFLLF